MALIETFRGVVFPWLADQMGHLTTSRYVEMFDVAAYHLGHRLKIGNDPASGFGVADVRQEIDYKLEVGVGVGPYSQWACFVWPIIFSYPTCHVRC